jgi:dTDP-glucose 4,6-dehydratase
LFPAREISQRRGIAMSSHLGGNGDRPRSLVTGGAGFVGSHLCDRLIAEGHTVICLDNLFTGRLENIQHLLGHPQFEFIPHDVTEPMVPAVLVEKSRKLLQGNGRKRFSLDFVLHLASPASPKDFAQFPVDTLKIGALGTYNALTLARSLGSVFFLASSSEVYGDPEMTPQPESYWGHVNPIGLRSVYDEAKRYAEALTRAFHREYGVEVRIARFFNTYGERMRLDDGRVLPNFITQALTGRPLTVYGDGSQTRSLCYVGDLVDGIYRLVLSSETLPVNLGNPEEITVFELAQEVIELTGAISGLVFKPLPADDPKRRRPDISKAVRRLEWRPKVTRREGIARVIPDFRARLEALESSPLLHDQPVPVALPVAVEGGPI